MSVLYWLGFQNLARSDAGVRCVGPTGGRGYLPTLEAQSGSPLSADQAEPLDISLLR